MAVSVRVALLLALAVLLEPCLAAPRRPAGLDAGPQRPGPPSRRGGDAAAASRVSVAAESKPEPEPATFDSPAAGGQLRGTVRSSGQTVPEGTVMTLLQPDGRNVNFDLGAVLAGRAPLPRGFGPSTSQLAKRSAGSPGVSGMPARCLQTSPVASPAAFSADSASRTNTPFVASAALQFAPFLAPECAASADWTFATTIACEDVDAILQVGSIDIAAASGAVAPTRIAKLDAEALAALAPSDGRPRVCQAATSVRVPQGGARMLAGGQVSTSFFFPSGALPALPDYDTRALPAPAVSPPPRTELACSHGRLIEVKGATAYRSTRASVVGGGGAPNGGLTGYVVANETRSPAELILAPFRCVEDASRAAIRACDGRPRCVLTERELTLGAGSALLAQCTGPELVTYIGAAYNCVDRLGN